MMYVFDMYKYINMFRAYGTSKNNLNPFQRIEIRCYKMKHRYAILSYNELVVVIPYRVSPHDRPRARDPDYMIVTDFNPCVYRRKAIQEP